MKKSTMRVLSLVMALMMIVGTLAVIPFSADDTQPTATATQTEEKHTTHTKGTLVETVEATCKLYGYSVYNCAECGKAYLDDVTEPTGDHVPQEVGEIPATCEEAGREAGVICAKCGEVLSGCGPKPKAHVVAYRINDLHDCEKGVTFVSYCKICNKILDDEEIKKADVRNDIVVAEKKHGDDLVADVKVAPTCSEYGSADIYCTAENCEFKLEGVVVNKLDHEYVFKLQEATFYGNEKWYKQCKICGEIESYDKEEENLHKEGDKKFYKEIKESEYEANKTKPESNEPNPDYVKTVDEDGNDLYLKRDDQENMDKEGIVGTSHAAILGDNDPLVKEIAAAVKALKAGQKYERTYTFNGKTYTYTKSIKACDHDTNAKRWQVNGYMFTYDQKDIDPDADSKDVTKKMSDFDAPEDFFEEYAKYRDIATLYVEYECTNERCQETKKDVLFNKLGHVYDSHIFEIRIKVDDQNYVEVRVYFDQKTDVQLSAEPDNFGVYHLYAGYDTENYKCGTVPTAEKLCAFCAARKGVEAAKISNKLGSEQKHTKTYLCQNEECKGEDNVYVINEEEYYVCGNCDHECWIYCLNKDTYNESGLCETLLNADGTAYDPENGEYVKVTRVHKVSEGAEEFLMPANCVEKAYYYNKCEVCGAAIKIDGTEFGEIDADNHDFENTKLSATITLEPATCVAPGREIRYCNRTNCNAWQTFEIPVDTENGHALYTRDTNGVKGISKAKFEALGLELDPRDVIEATCTSDRVEKWYCDYCGIVYLTIKDSKLDATKVASHKNVETVEAKAQNCLTGATYAYTYCKDCGIIITINNEDVIEEEYNVATDLDKIIVPNVGVLFTPEEWNGDDEGKGAKFGGDTRLQYEVITKADGTPITYKLTAGGKGHTMIVEDGYEATCFTAGLKDKYKCKVCDFVDAGERDGAQIRPIAHKNAKTQSVKAGDEDRVVETWEFTGATGVSDKHLQQIWALRAIEVRVNEVNPEAKDYKIAYVPATCTEDGYIIGKYCPDCMNLIPDEDDEDVMVANEYFDAYGVEDNTDTEDVDETVPANIAGYKLEKTGHAQLTYVTGADETVACGEGNYSYKIYRCTNENCGEYVVTDFKAAKNKAHKVNTYDADNDELGVKKGDAVIYTFAFGENDQVVIIEKKNGKYVYAGTENAFAYQDCQDTLYTGKRCVNCGEFIDVEEIAPIGHYTVKVDGTKEAIDITCTNYKEYVGLYCFSCKYFVPNVVVEKDADGRDVEIYYNVDGAKLEAVKDDNGTVIAYKGPKANDPALADFPATVNYFVLDHNWATPQYICEALNADIKSCATCGINVKNEKKADGQVYHQYYHWTNKTYNVACGLAKLETEDLLAGGYKDYAFDDVTYPTPYAEGLGTITCRVCGKVSEIVIPATDAEATIELDSEDIAIVGDVVTATIYVSAKDFAFNQLKVVFNNQIERQIALVDVEVLYEFDAIDAVFASVDGEGNVLVRTPGIANRNVVVSGKDTPFLRLYFQICDVIEGRKTVLAGISVAEIQDTIYDETNKENPYKEIKKEINMPLAGITVYNPAYEASAVVVLSQIYSTDYTTQYDFNKDDRVDLDDYFALVDFIDSNGTVADFCTLIGYDVEAMLENVKFDQYSSGKVVTFDPNHKTADGKVGYDHGTETDITYGKVVIRKAFSETSYKSILNINDNTRTDDGLVKTIAEFAQYVIDKA